MSFGKHQTFHIREGWLRKGLLAVDEDPRAFYGDYPTDALGIGTNMVKALRYWVEATGLVTTERNGRLIEFKWTELARQITDWDPYLELPGTWLVLHYQLATNEEDVPTWYWFFNLLDVRSFSTKSIIEHLRHWALVAYSKDLPRNTAKKDISCLLRTYERPRLGKRDRVTEGLSCPLSELGLVRQTEEQYQKQSPSESVLTWEIVAYALARFCNDLNVYEVDLEDLQIEPCSPGRVFNLNYENILQYISVLQDRGILELSRTAGLDTIKIRDSSAPNDFLGQYYSNYAQGWGQLDEID